MERISALSRFRAAQFSLISENDFNDLNLNIKIKHSNITFQSYSGNITESKGKVNVKYQNKEIEGELLSSQWP